jgi:hypothetical protein
LRSTPSAPRIFLSLTIASAGILADEILAPGTIRTLAVACTTGSRAGVHCAGAAAVAEARIARSIMLFV